MTALTDALTRVGVSVGAAAVGNLGRGISAFNAQNLSPQQILQLGSSLGATILGSTNVTRSFLPSFLTAGNGGVWTSTHYADDLNAHHPKFKFLFKVNFIGFANNAQGRPIEFSYFVHRCDKPKVKFVHQDVNFYNFRTRVLTNVVFDPLQVTFLDEIGNSVNQFFATYLGNQSSQGRGFASTDGGTQYSSSLPYKNGYSTGRRVEIQQIFANGVMSNIFTFLNPRIEVFDFDELNMEEGNSGSMVTVTFHYDALMCETVQYTAINDWGRKDLYRGGDVGGPGSGIAALLQAGIGIASALGNGVGNTGIALASQFVPGVVAGFGAPGALPGSLVGLTPTPFAPSFNQPGPVGSEGTVLSRDISNTFASIKDGSNLNFAPNGNTGVIPGGT